MVEKIQQPNTVYLPKGGEDVWHLAQPDLRVIIDKARLEALKIQHFQAESQSFEMPTQWQEWILSQFEEGDKPHLVDANEGEIHMPDLGGLGDLHQWEALIGKSEEELSPEYAERALAEEPPGAWMPEMGGVFISKRKDCSTTCPPMLAASVQMHNLGHLVHLGYPAQKSRLGKQGDSIQLFQPVNPFRMAPLPMSRGKNNYF